jgi:hypothetical protein
LFPCAQTLRAGKGEPDDLVERSTLQHIKGYYATIEKIDRYGNVKQLRKWVPVNAHAGLKWLAARRPEVYREQKNVKHMLSMDHSPPPRHSHLPAALSPLARRSWRSRREAGQKMFAHLEWLVERVNVSVRQLYYVSHAQRPYTKSAYKIRTERKKSKRGQSRDST